MKSIENIFRNSIRDYDNFDNLDNFIKETVFELSHKKIYRLKDEKRIQSRVLELFEMYINGLKDIKLYSTDYVQSIISGLVSAVNYEKERRIYELYYEKERIEKEIEHEVNHIQISSKATYKTFEKFEDNDTFIENALKDSKLRGTQMLGILKEVTSEAILTTIEKEHDIQETIETIVKNLVYQNVTDGDFTKERFLQIVKTILNVAKEIADIDQANSKDILKGAILGSREGMSKAVELFKNRLKYAPKDEENMSENDLQAAKKELLTMDNDFIELLRGYTLQTNLISGKIISNLLNTELDTVMVRMRKVSNEAREVINEKLEELNQNASIKLELLKESAEELEKTALLKMDELANNPKAQQVTQEAKKLGERAWEVAKEFAKNAKDAINKK